MKYYSETLKKLFDSEEELTREQKRQADLAAAKEKANELKRQARAKKAKEVDEAFKVAKDARANALKVLEEFNKEYGPFHTSYSFNEEEEEPAAAFDFLTSLFKFLD